MHAAWIGIGFTVLINLVSAAFTTGTVLTRLSNVEDKIKAQEIVIKEATKLETKMAVIENTLGQINLTLTRLERTLRPKE